MKRLFLLGIVFLCLWTTISQARVLLSVVGGAGCSTSNDSQQWQSGTGSGAGDNPNTYQATKFTIGSTTTITEYLITGKDQYYDDYRGTITAEIWTDNSGSPGSVISGTSKTITMPFTTTISQQAIDLDTPHQLSSGTYWLVISRTGGNYFTWRRDYDGSQDEKDSADGSSWNDHAGYYLIATIMGCTP